MIDISTFSSREEINAKISDLGRQAYAVMHDTSMAREDRIIKNHEIENDIEELKKAKAKMPHIKGEFSGVVAYLKDRGYLD